MSPTQQIHKLPRSGFGFQKKSKEKTASYLDQISFKYRSLNPTTTASSKMVAADITNNYCIFSV
jgi:hypothetical protein